MKSLDLPVETALDPLRQALIERDEAVLEAPPGAGKTTLVPLALLDEPWLDGRKILMLEPRRIAAKAAAHRMADLVGEPPGQTIGYRMRLDTRVGRDTRIEIITEGILTRMLQQDPTLDGIGLVIFDEFHERSLDSDLALALCLQARALFAGDDSDQSASTKILIMSATLDTGAIATLLGDAPVINSSGQSYPVELVYGRATDSRERIEQRMFGTIKQALKDNPASSLLAFLPGQGEIHRLADDLEQWLRDSGSSDIHLCPLYGDLSIEQQQQAIAPLSGNQRKIVMATNIAETSLTIEGIDVVIDSGLVREPRFDPSTGMTGLHTVKISAASSTQRAGRAGRLRAGKCYRLWSEAQQRQLAPQTGAEITQADLAPLALQLLQWGVDDPGELAWLDPPPRGAWQQALDLLDTLGAVECRQGARVLSPHGSLMAELPLHPRLAQLLIYGAASGQVKTAALIAALLSERDPLTRDNPDLAHRVDLLDGKTECPRPYRGWLQRTRRLAGQLESRLKQSGKIERKLMPALDSDQLPGYLVACAYPDRIARRRHSGGYQLANGRSASLAEEHYLGNSRWLAVAEVGGLAGSRGDRIRSAAVLDETLFEQHLQDFVHAETVAEWDKKSGRFIAEQQRKIGALVLARSTLETVPVEARTTALLRHLGRQGINSLGWSPELEQWCARVCLARDVEGEETWPDLSRETLQATLGEWLAPYLEPINSLNELKNLDLDSILRSRLSWQQQQRLNEIAPGRLTVPSGSSIKIDYTQSPPVLAVKLQEMFGCEQTPTVLTGRVALVVHLLSPAGRPLQVTQDLAGFWRTSYREVQKEMKGRYPKHPWPDDPLTAIPTRKTKNRQRSEGSS